MHLNTSTMWRQNQPAQDRLPTLPPLKIHDLIRSLKDRKLLQLPTAVAQQPQLHMFSILTTVNTEILHSPLSYGGFHIFQF